MRRPSLTDREMAHIQAALRFYGRAVQTSGMNPALHMFVRARLGKFTPMTLDEIEGLIGRLDGTWKRKRRPWNPMRDLK